MRATTNRLVVRLSSADEDGRKHWFVSLGASRPYPDAPQRGSLPIEPAVMEVAQ